MSNSIPSLSKHNTSDGLQNTAGPKSHVLFKKGQVVYKYCVEKIQLSKRIILYMQHHLIISMLHHLINTTQKKGPI